MTSHPGPVKPCWSQCQRWYCRRAFFSTLHGCRWDYCGHAAGAGFSYGEIGCANAYQSWDGCSFLQYPQWTLLADFEVSSDASGALGYGAVVQGHWFSGASLAKQVSQSIEYKHGEAPFPYGRGSLPQGSPYGPSNGSTSGNSAVWYFKSPLPSCPRFAVCRYWQLNIPSLSLRPQLEGSLARSIPVLLSVSALSPVSPSCRLRSNPDPRQLLLDKWNFYLNQGLAPSTRKVYASAERRFLDFYAQDNSLPFWGSALPASEDVLIHFCCHLADYLSTIYPLPFSNPIPSHQGGSAFSTGWLPSVTAGVSAYQTSPRLKLASVRTHHNRADAQYLPVLLWLQPYDALSCLLSRLFWFLTR